jgi:hypothetical protein
MTGKNLIYKSMKRINLKLAVTFLTIITFSCNEPETVVTDIVHTDGSVTRKIEMKNSKNNFSMKDLQVPFDSTWAIKDSLEINKKGDTTWVKRAEKLFATIEDLNVTYKRDSGHNKDAVRHTEFRKQFRWFNTDYIFSEIIDKNLKFGYPVSDFLNKEELNFYYSPGKLNDEKLMGADSLKYKALKDTIDKKKDRWTYKSLVSEWIGEFNRIAPPRSGKEMSFETLKGRENEFVKSIEKYSKGFDSLWANGIILRDLFGDTNALKYRSYADSAMNVATKRLLISFNNYSLRIIMPGRLTGTNGFIDSSHVLLWPVQSDYFLTEPYRMWAESKTTNKWAWVVTGLFLVFVAAGLIIRKIKS